MHVKEQLKRLRRELSDAGVFEHREAAGWLKFSSFLLGVGACIAGIVLLPGWAALLLVPAAGVAATSATMLGHEGGHRSFSAKPVNNSLLLYLSLPLFAGMSALYWKHKHNQLHHGHPNVLDADPDIELWPMAMSRRDYERAGPLHRWFQRTVQSYFFWPMSVIIPTSMRLPSLPFLIRHARTRGMDSAWAFDVICLAVHHVLWLVIPSMIFGVLPALALYLSLWAVVGVLLSMIFSPAHIGLPIVREQRSDWVHNLDTTCNLRTSRVLSWFMIGLDYQIEHHIFPGIPHHNMPTASRIVSRWCRENGLPYQSESYGTALLRVTHFMRDAWTFDVAENASRESLPPPPGPEYDRSGTAEAA